MLKNRVKSNNYSVTTRDLALSLQKAASVSNTFGISIDELIGLSGALMEVTRESGNQTGNAIKGIVSRMTTIDASVSAIENAGVAVRDSNGEMRDAFDILKDLSEVYPTLSKEQQQNTAVSVAGRYQVSRFLGLMQQFPQVMSIVETSVGSAGSSLQEQEKYSESLQARINRLSAEWSNFAYNLGQSTISDSLIAGLQIATASVEALSNSIGLIPMGIGLAAASLVFFNGKLRTTSSNLIFAKKGTDKFNTSVTTLSNGLKGLGAATLVGAGITALTFILDGLIGKISEAIQKQEEFQKSQETSMESIANEKDTIDQLVAEYEELSNLDVNRNTEQEERYVQLQNELAALLPQIKQGEDDKGNSIISNTQAVKDHIAVLEEQLAYQRELDAQTADATILSAESDIEDAEKEMKRRQEFLDGFIKLQKEAAEADDIGKVDSLSKEINDERTAIADLQNQINEANGQIASSFEAVAHHYAGINNLDLSDSDVSFVSQIASDANMSKTQVEGLADTVSTLKQELGSEFSLQGLNADQVNAIGSVINSVEKGSTSWDDFKSQLQDVGIESNILSGILGNLRNSENEISAAAQQAGQDTRLVTPVFDELGNIISFTTEQINANSEAMGENGEEVTDWATRISEAEGKFAELRNIIMEMVQAGEYEQATTTAQKEAYEALADELSPINGLLEKMAEGKQLSSAEAMNLINQEHELANAISFENGQVKINEEAVLNLRDAKVKSYNDMVQSIAEETKAIANSTLNNLRQYGIEIEGIQSLADARRKLNDVTSEYNELSGYGATGTSALEQATNPETGEVDVEKLKKLREERDAYEQASEALGNYVDVQGEIDKTNELINQSFNEVGTSQEKLSEASDESRKSAKDQTAELEKSRYVANEYSESLEELNAEIEVLDSYQNNYAKHSAKYRQALQREIDLLERKQQLLKAQAEALRTQIANGNITQYGIVTDTQTVGLPSSNISQGSNRASGSGVEATIWNFFKSKGFTDSVTAGIMGNLKMESNLNTSAVNPSSGASGLAQWLGGRKTNLMNYAASRGTSWTDLQTQLDFLWKELNGSESRSMNWLQSNQNASAATVAAMFDKLFERSEGTHVPQRQKYANQFFSRYSGGSAPVSGGGGNAADLARDRIEAQNEASMLEAQRQQSLAQAELDLLSLESEIISINDLIEDLNYQVIESHLARFDNQKKQWDDDLARIEYEQSTVTESSERWRKLEKQRQNILNKQRQEQANSIKFIEAQMKNNKDLTEYQMDMLNNELIDRTQTLLDMTAQINELTMSIIESTLAGYDRVQQFLQREFAKLDYNQLLAGEGTTDWVQLELEREKLLKRQRDIQEDEIAFIEKQIKTNKNLTSAQKDRLDEEILNRTNELWEMEQEILNLRISMAEQIIDTYNQALEAQKEASVKAIDELISEIDKEMEEADWNKKLRNQQKERQEIIDEISELALDDSDSARKRMEELNDLLQEADEALDNMQTEREVDLRKESLENDRTEVEEYYDNLINDEKRLAQMRQTIISGSTNQIEKDLKKFQKNLKSMSDELGEAAVNNLIRMINSANVYLGGSRPIKPASLDTGGFTGSFKGGRLAVLHEKELILNKNDTSNMIKLVDWTRDIIGSLKSFSIPSLSPITSNGGTTNELSLHLNIDNMNGTKKEVDFILDEAVRGLGKMGFKMK